MTHITQGVEIQPIPLIPLTVLISHFVQGNVFEIIVHI
jgi:hypothetical protein